MFPVMLIAGNIKLSLNKHNAESSYSVRSDNQQNLKSTLNFPLRFTSFNISYTHQYYTLYITLKSSFLLKSTTSIGKDFDWKDNKLTVYSMSKNNIEKYYSNEIEVSKNIINNLSLFLKFNYQVIHINWKDTYQEDYVQNINESISGKTLTFNQVFYKYKLGVSYQNPINKNFNYQIRPSLVYAFIHTKDTHILRNFYTIQDIQTYGYEIDFSISYTISEKSHIYLSYNYQKIVEKHTDMNYYNIFKQNYLTYPSSYKYTSRILSLGYNYKF